MKKSILIKNKGLLSVVIALLLLLTDCTLDEEVYSIYTPDTYYDNETQVLSSLSGIYRNFCLLSQGGQPYRVIELSADQLMIPGRSNGWWVSETFYQLMEHTWTADLNYRPYGSFFSIVGQTNALIASLELSNLDGLDNAKAELRSLRAYAYFLLMDLYGNVPIFTAAKVEAADLPKQNTRVEVFDFIVSELTDALTDLPSQNDVGSEYYGRFTKEAAYSLLATIYLNAEIYTGTAHYDDVLTYTNLVINSGAYSLLTDYAEVFAYDNEENAEQIFSGVYTPNITGGLGQAFTIKNLPGISGGLFDLPYTPQNGYAVRQGLLDLYEDQDVRKKMFLGGCGPLIDPRNGDTVMVENVVTDANSTLYELGISTSGPVPYITVALTALRDQPLNAGIRWLKWGLDPDTNGGQDNNDFAFLRYADVLLMKAEALLRSGGDIDDAIALINQVRDRSNASSLETLTLDDIIDERGRELCFEMTRRRDLIRFGKFTESWEFKDDDDGSFRTLFPIPPSELSSNPNLVQNPGY